MNSIHNESRGQDRMAQKASYERPKVTTFGSVAKLTHGTHSVGNDAGAGKKNSRG